MRNALIIIAAAALAAACGDDLEARDDPQEIPSDNTTQHEKYGEVTLTRGDASAEGEWVHLDIDTGKEVAETGAWDLAFQRFHIISNGGVSGSAGVEVAALDGATFDGVQNAPTAGFIADAADGADD